MLDPTAEEASYLKHFFHLYYRTGFMGKVSACPYSIPPPPPLRHKPSLCILGDVQDLWASFLTLQDSAWLKDWVNFILLKDTVGDGNSKLPDLVCVITGKEPQKSYCNWRIAKNKWTVKFCLPWLEAKDYLFILASVDIWVCLHMSSHKSYWHVWLWVAC